MTLPRMHNLLATPSRRISLSGLVLIALTILAAAVAIWDRRAEAIAHSEQEMTRLSLLLEQQTARSIQAVDLVLQETQARVAAAGIDNADQLKRQMGTEAFHQFFAQRLQSIPQSSGLGLIGADGVMINDGKQWPAPPLNLRDRDYYAHFLGTNDKGVFVSAPAINRIGRRWSFFLARRVNGPDGQFIGIAVGLIDIGYLEQFYGAVTSGDGDAIALYRSDGTLLARHPPVGEMIGSKLPADSRWYPTVANGGATYRTLGSVSASPRIVSARPLREYPLVVNAGVAEDAALAGWRREAFFIGLAAIGAALGFALLFRALAARSRKLERQATELQVTADALRDSEARFHDFALTSSDWFWETDREHRLAFLSEEIRGFSRDPKRNIGRTRQSLAADAETDADKWRQHTATLDRHERFRDFVYTLQAVDGRDELIVSVSGKPVFDAEGQFLGYRGTTRDVTEKIRAERALRDAKMAAEAANIAKSQFLANISHELRTPLNAIIGFSEMLSLGIIGSMSAQQQEYAEIVTSSGKHLLGIVNDLLDLAKIDAGRLELEEQRIDLRRFAKACVEMIRDRAQELGLSLTIECDPDLPTLIADPRRLKQVVLNLLSNAIKFTGPGGRVAFGLQRAADGGVALYVRDTGVGMTPDEIAVALEPFGQVDAGLSRRHEGTGLGLPLARSLVDLHGGSFQIDSQKGHGTTVTALLPASRVIEAGALAALPARQVATA